MHMVQKDAKIEGTRRAELALTTRIAAAGPPALLIISALIIPALKLSCMRILEDVLRLAPGAAHMAQRIDVMNAHHMDRDD